MFRNQPLLTLRASWIIGLLVASLAFGQYTQTVGDNGVVDWGQQRIRATGIGAPRPDAPPGAQRAGAIEAAKLAALRNLLQTVQGVNISSETTVRNAMVENDVINTKVQGIIRGYTIVDTRYLSDQSVEVEIEVPLSGVLADALLPQNFGGGRLLTAQPLCPVCGQPWPQGKPVPPGVQLITPGTPGQPSTGAAGGAFTGLIIDAKGLGLMPAMAPKVVDENGNEIYGSKYVSREFAVKQGMVGYDKDVNAARNNQRVTNNPLIIKAVRATGTNKTDLIVANADAQRIHSAAQTQNFLDKCRVMFILD
ncbi:MAG: LPP20 family lipoprotein [candidate division KSB1 bacterium]|nr:LPP20 family lipoprotein [candidate division KSB1 bacterium]MDZ7300548.1 LPP20 family lipoprotein [candidate division KSB1 bacterium]MDZ7309687.1 LPP20 family lipoprotein [candidate division KSB1 bacterium]